MPFNFFRYHDEDSKSKFVLYVFIIVLFFFTLCWGIWWFFDYKEKALRNEAMLPKPNVMNVYKQGRHPAELCTSNMIIYQ